MRRLPFVTARYLSGRLGVRPADCARLQQPVEGSRAAAANHQEDRVSDHEQVVLVAFPFLRSHPVHKEPVREMDHQDRHHHVAEDAEGRDPRQQPDDQAQSAKEFRGDREERKRRRNMHTTCERPHRSAKTMASEPAQHLLRTVSEEDYPENQAKYCRPSVVVRCNQFAKHNVLSLRIFKILYCGRRPKRSPQMMRPFVLVTGFFISRYIPGQGSSAVLSSLPVLLRSRGQPKFPCSGSTLEEIQWARPTFEKKIERTHSYAPCVYCGPRGRPASSAALRTPPCRGRPHNGVPGRRVFGLLGRKPGARCAAGQRCYGRDH